VQINELCLLCLWREGDRCVHPACVRELPPAGMGNAICTLRWPVDPDDDIEASRREVLEITHRRGYCATI